MEDIFQTIPAKVKCRFPYKITFDFKMFVKCLEGHVIIYEIQRICCVMLPALSDGVSLKKKKIPFVLMLRHQLYCQSMSVTFLLLHLKPFRPVQA